MSTQLQLLSDYPASRANDPVTSHEAAREITQSGLKGKQQRLVLGLVRQNPGRTSAELAAIGQVDRYMVARRLPELEPLHARKGDTKRCHISGRNAVVWWPAGVCRSGTG